MGGGERADLRFECDGAEAVEELEGRDDLALYEDAGRDCCRRPEARAHGHLVEPLLQWELTGPSSDAAATVAEHVLHF